MAWTGGCYGVYFKRDWILKCGRLRVRFDVVGKWGGGLGGMRDGADNIHLGVIVSPLGGGQREDESEMI